MFEVSRLLFIALVASCCVLCVAYVWIVDARCLFVVVCLFACLLLCVACCVAFTVRGVL